MANKILWRQENAVWGTCHPWGISFFTLQNLIGGMWGGGGGLPAAPLAALGGQLPRPKERVDCPALPGPVQVIWATGERAITPLPKQKQKPSLQPFPLTLKGTDQNCGRLLSFFPYKMKITPTPKRLVAQRRRREGACCPKGHRQPSSRSKRDLLGRRSGDGAAKECPILNWVFREQRSPPRRGFPKGRVPLGASPVTPASAQQPSRTESKAPPKGASGLSGFTRTNSERAILSTPARSENYPSNRSP